MKKLFKSEQSGRSMVEMLGVLAIIGVLSVGGIAGYSKAMEKFKINKTIDQISHIATNIRTLYAQQTTYTGLNTANAIQMGVTPNELGSSISQNIDISGLINPFNGVVTISSVADSNNKTFQIAYTNLTESACIALATQDWGSDNSSGLQSLTVFNDVVSHFTNGDSYAGFPCYAMLDNFSGESHYIVGCPNDPTLPIPIPVALATKICANCKEGEYGCGISLEFH